MSDPAGEFAQPSESAEVARPRWPHLIHLHRELDSAWSLYRDEYYDEAVRKASQRYANRAKELTNRPDLDGSALMEHAFSAQSPLLEFSDRGTLIERDEHDGYRFLAVGLTRALRNVLSHTDSYGLDEASALEWLTFISAMHRRLDQAQQVTTAQGQ